MGELIITLLIIFLIDQICNRLNVEQVFEDADKMMYENKNSRKELIFN